MNGSKKEEQSRDIFDDAALKYGFHGDLCS